MSDVAATLLAALLGGMIGLAGSLVGGVIALFGPRYLRTRGDLRLRTSRWELKPSGNQADPAAYTYKLSIYMYNDMEIDTAAQDVQVILGNLVDSELLVSTPKEAVEPYYRLDSVALPSRGAINKDAIGEIDTDILNKHFGDPSGEMSIPSVRLKGFWPTGKAFMHEVVTNGKVNGATSKDNQWLGPWYQRIF